MTRQEHNRLEDVEATISDENHVGFDAGLRALRAATDVSEPAETPGEYLAPKHDPAPVLQPADEGGFRLVPAGPREPEGGA